MVDEDHLDELDAQHWISAWEREVERHGLGRYSETFWEPGRAWDRRAAQIGAPNGAVGDPRFSQAANYAVTSVADPSGGVGDRAPRGASGGDDHWLPAGDFAPEVLS